MFDYPHFPSGIDILCHLRDTVSRKCCEKWRTNSWFLLHDNAPIHRLVLVKDFIVKNNMTILEHLPYSSNLAAADFYLFSQLKSAMMGQDFSDAADIIQNVTDELKRLS